MEKDKSKEELPLYTVPIPGGDKVVSSWEAAAVLLFQHVLVPMVTRAQH